MSKTARLIIALAFILPFAARILVFGGSGQAGRILENPIILLLQTGLAVFPFLVVTTVNVGAPRLRAALLAGFALTAGVWSWIAVTSWRVQTPSAENGGASIELGVLLLILPVLVLAFMAFYAGPSPTRRRYE